MKIIASLFLSTSLAACSSLGLGGDGSGPGGKADDAASCDDPGRNCLDTRSHEVLFTNPICTELGYEDPVESADGNSQRTTKPKNVYCTRDDAQASAARENAPEKRLLDWIEPLESGDEIFLAYLSYSNRVVGDALCRAAERGVDVKFVLDRPTDRGDELEACGGEVLIRGHQGSIGFAHVKLVLINSFSPGPGDADDTFMKLSFSSGNMSSGTVLHHENWHFLEVNRDSHFVEAHRCLQEALTEGALTDGKTPFRSFMNDCRAAIPFEEEHDIRAFFIPVREDSKAITALVEDGIADADNIAIAAHRFGWRDMLNALIARLANDSSFELDLVADDDLYWLRPLKGAAKQVGPNDFFEADNIDDLRDAGGDRFEVRYLETNHSLFLLHHNKFIIFNGLPGRADAVLTGSPNLTGTGFNDNLENVYWIEIPEVLDAYRRQHDNFWDGLQSAGGPRHPATRPGDMPSVDIALNSDDAVTPGGGNPDGLVINEILSDPAPGFDANGDGSASTLADEFVEIINTGSDSVDLSGVTISDSIRVRATLAQGTVLEAGQALVVFGGGSPNAADFDGAIVATGNGSSLSLNNGGDTITVAAADGTVLAEVTYSQRDDESQTRAVDGDGNSSFVAHTSVSSEMASPGRQSNGTAF